MVDLLNLVSLLPDIHPLYCLPHPLISLPLSTSLYMFAHSSIQESSSSASIGLQGEKMGWDGCIGCVQEGDVIQCVCFLSLSCEHCYPL